MADIDLTLVDGQQIRFKGGYVVADDELILQSYEAPFVALSFPVDSVKQMLVLPDECDLFYSVATVH
jgi:hypothetical protein